MQVAKQLPRDPEAYKRIHAVADAYLRAFEEAFLLATDDLLEAFREDEIARLIADGRPLLIVESIDWAAAYEEPLLANWQPLLEAIVRQAGVEAVQAFEFQYRFDLDNPYSQQWIREHGATLVREITDETREAVRNIVEEAWRYGGHPYEQARRIRNIVGLTQRQAAAVERYRLGLLEQGIDEERADALAQRYAARLRRDRARTISRTETLTAANAGQESAVRVAADMGLIDPAITKRVWIITPDERLCPRICEHMRGVAVPFDQPFRTPVGEMWHPPAHPQCRCAWGLKVEVPE